MSFRSTTSRQNSSDRLFAETIEAAAADASITDEATSDDSGKRESARAGHTGPKATAARSTVKKSNMAPGPGSETPWEVRSNQEATSLFHDPRIELDGATVQSEPSVFVSPPSEVPAGLVGQRSVRELEPAAQVRAAIGTSGTGSGPHVVRDGRSLFGDNRVVAGCFMGGVLVLGLLLGMLNAGEDAAEADPEADDGRGAAALLEDADN